LAAVSSKGLNTYIRKKVQASEQPTRPPKTAVEDKLKPERLVAEGDSKLRFKFIFLGERAM